MCYFSNRYFAYGIYYLAVPTKTEERTSPWYERTLFASSGTRLHRTCVEVFSRCVDLTQQRPLEEKEATRGRTITCLGGGKLGLQVCLHMGNQQHMPQTLDGRIVKRRKLDNSFGIRIRFVVSFQDLPSKLSILNAFTLSITHAWLSIGSYVQGRRNMAYQFFVLGKPLGGSILSTLKILNKDIK
ncbi:uncharacterized protein LOC122536032 [Frieseomelitta varia]|uniref:uncharacterized protein LOC122536032 n=1 Tax=Frieseomelitta varia TaxID=561572 RepID=UPI001CB68843|nr:uncharacterized protein LOC122536032 [Frieseomelitta varia]